MPKIPTYIAQQGIKTGPVADQINVGAMTAPAVALGTYANAIQDVGAFFQNREKERGLRWTGDANYKFTNAMTEWHMANQTREDYGPAFKEYAEKVANDFVSAAPSKQAGEVLRHQLQGSISRQYEMALKVGEKTRFDNFELGEQNSTQAYNEMYRQLGSIDPVGASSTIDGQHTAQLARITEAYGTKAPAFAAKLRANATASVVQAVMDTDPDLAETILNESKDIPEQYRQIQLDKITQTRKQLSALGADAFKWSVADSLAQSQRNGEYAVQPSREAYDAVFQNPVVAAHEHEADRREFEVYNGALKVTNEFKGKSPSAIQADLAKAKSQFSGQVGQKVDAAVEEQAKALKKFANDYPVEYVQSYNPTVSKARELFEGATDKNRPGAFRQLNAETIKYQGHAPEGSPESEYYLGLDSHQVSLIPKVQAIEIAGQLNEGTPDEKVKAIRSFIGTYQGDPESEAIAWRDLVQLPEGKRITQQAEMLKLHAFEPYARQLAESMAPGKALENSKNKGLTLEDYNKEVKGPEWSSFAKMYGGDNTQRSDVVAGFRNAIVSYAASLNIDQPGQAVKMAIATLISSKFEFADVGGKTIPFAKWAGPDDRERSADDMKAVVASVRADFDSIIPADTIKKETDDKIPLWPAAPYHTTKQAGDAYVQEDLNKNKMLVPSEDGKGMYIYMNTKLGIPVQIRTTDNKPLFIPFDTTGKRRNLPTVPRKWQRQDKLEGGPAAIQEPPVAPVLNPPKSLSNLY